MTDLFLFVMKSWRAIVLGALLGCVVLAGFAMLQATQYRSETVLSVVTSEPNPGLSSLGALSDVASLAGIDLGGDAQQRRDAIATISSRQLARRFIESRELLPILFQDDWNAAEKRWEVADARNTPSLEKGVDHLVSDVLRVIEDRHTGLVSLTVDWTDPELAAEWANAYVALADEQLRSRAIAEAGASIDFLESELEGAAAVELKSFIYAMIETRLTEQMLANVRKEFAFRVIDPAVPSDVDEPYRPKVLLNALAGALLGALLGLLLARDLESRRGRARSEAQG